MNLESRCRLCEMLAMIQIHYDAGTFPVALSQWSRESLHLETGANKMSQDEDEVSFVVGKRIRQAKLKQN